MKNFAFPADVELVYSVRNAAKSVMHEMTARLGSHFLNLSIRTTTTGLKKRLILIDPVQQIEIDRVIADVRGNEFEHASFESNEERYELVRELMDISSLVRGGRAIEPTCIGEILLRIVKSARSDPDGFRKRAKIFAGQVGNQSSIRSISGGLPRS